MLEREFSDLSRHDSDVTAGKIMRVYNKFVKEKEQNLNDQGDFDEDKAGQVIEDHESAGAADVRTGGEPEAVSAHTNLFPMVAGSEV